MTETKVKRIHKVTYRGNYFSGGRDIKPYRITIDVPSEIVNNANIIGYLKEELRNENSDIYKTFIEEYPGFDRLYTHVLEDLSEKEEVVNVQSSS